MFLVPSPIVINVPTRGLLAVETTHAAVVSQLYTLPATLKYVSINSDVSRSVTICY